MGKMTFKEEISNDSNITRYYDSNDKDMLSWLINAKKLESVKYQFIEAERNGSPVRQISGYATITDLMILMKAVRPDAVQACGTYDGKPIVLGFNVNDKTVHITIRKSLPADINELEYKLTGSRHLTKPDLT